MVDLLVLNIYFRIAYSFDYLIASPIFAFTTLSEIFTYSQTKIPDFCVLRICNFLLTFVFKCTDLKCILNGAFLLIKYALGQMSLYILKCLSIKKILYILLGKKNANYYDYLFLPNRSKI